MTRLGRSHLRARWLGRVAYDEGVRLQGELVKARRSGTEPDTLLLLEHPPVITLGKGARSENVLISKRDLGARGIEIHDSARGGDVTYHGPGQLVGYPVLALNEGERDAHGYLRALEEALIRTSADYGIDAGRREGLTGVWVGDRKLASIGVRISTGWITSHGFALNVTTDLSGFETIVPCGIRGCAMTSIAELTGERPGLEEVGHRAAARLASAMSRSLERTPAAARVAAGALR
jgi:lipoyl(octanoyl) transferase